MRSVQAGIFSYGCHFVATPNCGRAWSALILARKLAILKHHFASGPDRIKGLTVQIRNFQDFVLALTQYWIDHGCIWSQPYDAQMGAGTFHPHTFLKSIGPEPWRAVYVQPCRRPVDGRYGKSTYRFQHYYQLQVLLKPAPANIVDLFLASLQHVGISLPDNDVCLLEDDWKGPTLGAWGLGWEIRANGQEVTQFTYFQQLGGLDVEVTPGEITYGLERLFMYATGVKSALDMPFNDDFTYGDVFVQNEFEFSHFNFTEANVPELYAHFELCERNVASLCDKKLVLPAYDYVLQASHAFNLLDARGAISVSERQRYIGRVRDCAKRCALIFRGEREALGFPMLTRISADPRADLHSRNPAHSSFRTDSPSLTEVREVRMYQGVQDFAGAPTCDVLFELGVEEMPPGFQASARDQLQEKAEAFRKGQAEKFAQEKAFATLCEGIKAEIFVSSRRLALRLTQVPVQEPRRFQEVWGPAERIAKTPQGDLSPAGLGFCRKNGIDPSIAVFKEKPDGVFLYALKELPGQDLPTLLAAEFKTWAENLTAPLKMRWLPETVSPAFIRPVRWLVALAGDRVIPCEMFGLSAGRKTAGQRILSPGWHTIDNARGYDGVLRGLGLMPDWTMRQETIVEKGQALSASVGGRLRKDDSLLDKCTGLAESPEVFIGAIEQKYMTLPPTLIVSVLREHMNYFAVENAAGQLLPYYVGVATYPCLHKAAMIEGTKTVVMGRLDDGAFYYETDLKTPLADFRDRLKSQLFQADMGTLWDKTERVAELAVRLLTLLRSRPADWGRFCNLIARADSSSQTAGTVSLSNEEIEHACRQAGLFCKADLKSGCVQEFPDDMQGVMGGVLARAQNAFGTQTELIATAIAEHYGPSGASSSLPATPLGQLIALADKLDSLVMMINQGADLKSNKDPFGLRRHAIGIVRLLGLEGLEKSSGGSALGFAIDEVLLATLETLSAKGWQAKSDTFEKAFTFLTGRLKAAWRLEFNPGAVEAVCARLEGRTLEDVRMLVVATQSALSKVGSGSLLEALVPYRRSRNLTQDVPMGVTAQSLRPELLNLDAEKVLFEVLLEIEKAAGHLLKEKKNEEFLNLLAKLGLPLAAFFETVLVNDPDARQKNNRLALLCRIRSLYETVADFSLVQVS